MKNSNQSGHTDYRFSMLRLLFIMKLCFIISVISISTISAIGSDENSQQQKRITGSITDSSTGETLPGVNIAIKVTTVGAISDAEVYSTRDGVTSTMREAYFGLSGMYYNPGL